MTTKPTNAQGLGRIWAETGTSIDPDSSIPGKYSTGWIQEIPPFEFMNFIQEFVTQFCNHVNEYGVPQWDNITDYPVGGLAQSTVDNQLYRSLITPNVGNEPSVSGAQWSLFTPGGAVTSDDVTNLSVVSGANVTDALNSLNTLITNLDSGDIANISAVTGADVTAALNTLNSAIGALGSNDISNESGVAGANVSNALDNLNTAISNLGSDDITNDSTIAGATVSAALEALNVTQGDYNPNLESTTSDTAVNIPNLDSFSVVNGQSYKIEIEVEILAASSGIVLANTNSADLSDENTAAVAFDSLTVLDTVISSGSLGFTIPASATSGNASIVRSVCYFIANADTTVNLTFSRETASGTLTLNRIGYTVTEL